MLSLEDAKTKDLRVTYDGSRSYLRSRKDLKTTGSISTYNNSAQVQYTNGLGETETDWVGFSALTRVENAVLNYLDDEKARLLAQIAKIDEARKLLEGMDV